MQPKYKYQILLGVVACLALGIGRAQTLAPTHVAVANVRAGSLAAAATYSPPNGIRITATGASFSGGIHGEWLHVQRHNVNDYENRGFDASYTNVVSDFKPVITKRGLQWEMTFGKGVDLP